MTQFEVRDGSRIFAFDGEMLGSVSSHRPSSPRWSEYKLYKTVGGMYILEKIGRSIVVHQPGCPRIVEALNRFESMHPGRDPEDGWWFCESCVHGGQYDLTALLVESDRNWAIVSEQADQVVDALYRKKAGAKSLPRLSLDLLDQVARVDDSIASAFRVERIG